MRFYSWAALTYIILVTSMAVDSYPNSLQTLKVQLPLESSSYIIINIISTHEYMDDYNILK